MKPTTSPTSVADLRSPAEASLPARAVVDETLAAQTPEAMLERLRHLEVHQLELELANAELRRAQIELEVSHARYFNFYNHAPVGYCTLGENGIISEANLTLANLLGVAPGALIGTPFQRFILRADQDWFYLLRQRITESRGALAQPVG